MSVAAVEPSHPGHAWRAPDGAWSDLVQVLRARAREGGDRLAFRFLDPGGTDEQVLTFAELDREARCIASALSAAGDLAGGCALLIYPPELEFVVAFFGCLYAGVVPAPVSFSLSPDRLKSLAAVVLSSGAQAVLASSNHLARVRRAVEAELPGAELRWIATDAIADEPLEGPAIARPTGSDLCFLQFSSGSTADPKGIAITHDNVVDNLGCLSRAFRVNSSDVQVTWLPHHHDMGLIAGILHGVYAGLPTVMMPPMAFLVRPISWLKTISTHRGTLSAGPNFAYDHCVRSLDPGASGELDLSCWDVAVSGAEPIRAPTLERFADAFSAAGFQRRAFFPSYGLAEATLMVSGGVRGRGARTVRVDAQGLEAGEARVLRPGTDEVRATELVGCGGTQGNLVLVVDPDTLAVRPDGRVGEVLVCGRGVAAGYWRQARLTAETFGVEILGRPGRRFLRTGDLGFLQDGELFITGRRKDLIIIRGRNLSPQDVEDSVRPCDGRFSAAAAFPLDVGGEERLAIVQEVEADRVQAEDLERLCSVVREVVRATHNVELARLALVAPGQIRKTTSGKVQRRLCRDILLSGRMRTLHDWRAEVPEDSHN